MEHLGPQVITHFLGIPITNTFFSVLIVDVILIGIGLIVFFTSKTIPTKIQAFFELVLEFIEDIGKILPDKIKKILLPILFVWFIFIWFNNWFGLFPGMETIVVHTEHGVVPLLKGASSDLNLTSAMAIVSFVIVEGTVLIYAGIKGWFKHFFHSGPLALIPLFIAIGVLELILEPVKFITLAMRLFGNILAGETLISTLSHIPLMAVPFLLLEVLVGVLQALVFITLTISFLGLMLNNEEH